MKQEKEEEAAAAKEEEVRKKREDAKLAEREEREMHKYIGYVFGAALMLSTGWPDRQTETTT